MCVERRGGERRIFKFCLIPLWLRPSESPHDDFLSFLPAGALTISLKDILVCF